ncbi:DNA nucleotidylexotransferase-like isoform X1 [Triplophysa rosa]|uniref:DNA nucleotidylexotransferase-like isoform X1 n=1 Tax=Triplophysa rosa TaxID=992332 RepID=UPI002545CE32|nr:DNA nucleotidylexotransferase-like isoform X1 [Triplophysa rosa]
MDHFHKCFLIVKLKRDEVCEQRETDEDRRRDWRAIRVDLVAPPIERYAYALLGWTGSTLFDRDLRRFARLERGKLLDNHVLYDKATLKTAAPYVSCGALKNLDNATLPQPPHTHIVWLSP